MAVSNNAVRGKSGSSPRNLSVVNVPISRLKLNAQNPRLHSKKQLRQLAKSIENFGFNAPVLIDSKYNVIAGHGRILACKELGWSEVPAIPLDHLNENQKRAFLIADNRLAENSSWDEGLLAENLKILADLELDFELDVTGFELGEIDIKIGQLSTVGDRENSEPETLQLETSSNVVAKPDDVWILGQHRIICGNALNPNTYNKLMVGKVAAMVFTDPPYNVPVVGHVTKRGERHREFAMASGEMNERDFGKFLADAFDLFARHSAKASIHFVCMDWRHAWEVTSASRAVYSEIKNICVWDKGVGGLGSLYRSQHELVFVFKNGRGSHKNNIQLGTHGRTRTNVWAYPSVNAFKQGTHEGKLQDLHPTVKPVSLVADAILDCSGRSDIVLDGFLGSGTTLIAAEHTGRRCYGIEIDPAYVDVIVRRFESLTGVMAINEATGKTFKQTEQNLRRRK